MESAKIASLLTRHLQAAGDDGVFGSPEGMTTTIDEELEVADTSTSFRVYVVEVDGHGVRLSGLGRCDAVIDRVKEPTTEGTIDFARARLVFLIWKRNSVNSEDEHVQPMNVCIDAEEINEHVCCIPTALRNELVTIRDSAFVQSAVQVLILCQPPQHTASALSPFLLCGYSLVETQLQPSRARSCGSTVTLRVDSDQSKQLRKRRTYLTPLREPQRLHATSGD
jgi:hypothetical protein